MKKWLHKHKFNKARFTINNTTNKSIYVYSCLTCGWKCHIHTVKDNKISFSNVQRHYSSQRCQKLEEKKKPTGIGSHIVNYFQKENNQQPPLNPNEVDFQSSSKNLSSIETPDTRLPAETSVVEKDPKNVLPPVGTPENTGNSGR